MKRYRHKKTKQICNLIKTTTETERGFTYYYMQNDGSVTVYGKKVFDELFEEIA